MPEQVPVHVRAEAARVLGRKPQELVHVERRGPRQVQRPPARQLHEVPVHVERRAPRDEPQHQLRRVTHRLGDARRAGSSRLLLRLEHP